MEKTITFEAVRITTENGKKKSSTGKSELWNLYKTPIGHIQEIKEDNG